MRARVRVVCVRVCVPKKSGGNKIITGCSVILCQRQNFIELMTTCGLEIASLDDSWTSQCLCLGLRVNYSVNMATNVKLNDCRLIFLLKDDS